MSWRERRQDTYINNGKTTITTIGRAETPGFWRVTQFKQYIGRQGDMSFEGVFEQEQADEWFKNLVAMAHDEVVLAPGTGKVLAGVIDGDEEGDFDAQYE